jgi:hypothetical protein
MDIAWRELRLLIELGDGRVEIPVREGVHPHARRRSQPDLADIPLRDIDLQLQS